MFYLRFVRSEKVLSALARVAVRSLCAAVWGLPPSSLNRDLRRSLSTGSLAAARRINHPLTVTLRAAPALAHDGCECGGSGSGVITQWGGGAGVTVEEAPSILGRVSTLELMCDI